MRQSSSSTTFTPPLPAPVGSGYADLLQALEPRLQLLGVAGYLGRDDRDTITDRQRAKARRPEDEQRAEEVSARRDAAVAA